MQQSVLITGISGFLGGYIASEFLKQDYQVTGVDAPGREASQSRRAPRHEYVDIPSSTFNSLIEELQPDILVNCAGRASVGLSILNPSLDYYANTVLVFELLEAVRVYAPSCRVILLSSAAVYGNPPSLPIHESQKCLPLSPYGYHKVQAESLCMEYAEIHGIQTVVARLFSAYGPGLRRQVLWDIYRKSIKEPSVELMGTGDETRDFLHAADVATAIRILAERCNCKGQVFNVASGNEVSIKHLAYVLMSNLGITQPARFNGIRDPGNPSNWRADIQKLQSLGFTASIPLETGIQDFLRWCRSLPEE